MKRIDSMRTGLAVLISVMLIGCGQDQKTEEVKQDTDVLKIGVLNTADSAVLYAAEQDRLYDEYGANVELVNFSSASDQSKAVEAGEIDGIMTDLIVQSMINKSEDCHLKTILVALGDRPENGKFVIAAAPGNAHNIIDQLEDAKIAISEGTGMEFLLDSYCEVLNIDLNTIEKVNVPNIALRMEMLLEGKDIDAAILPEPLGDYSVMKGAEVVIDDTKLDVNLSISVIAVEDDYIIKNQENVEHFIDAYSEAAHRINTDKEAYRQLVLDVANIPQEMQDTYVIPDYSERNIPEKELFDRIQLWLVNKKMLEQPYTYDDMIMQMD